MLPYQIGPPPFGGENGWMTNACTAEKVGGLEGKFAWEVAPCRSTLAAVQYITVTLAPMTTHVPEDD